MKDCEECGKKLGVFEGYRHPTMGKKHLLCSPCFDQISESVARWGEFVRTNSFNANAAQNNAQMNWKEMIPTFNSTRYIFDNVLAEKELFGIQK
jgi:hypothetical protein